MKVFTVKLNDVMSGNQSLSPHDYVKQHEESQKAYWRRLERLYRCHHLPHRICEYLNITGKQFVDDLQQLHEKGVCLSVDDRNDVDFESVKAPSELGKVSYQRLIDDETFYASLGLSIASRCRLLMLSRSRWKHLDIEKPTTSKESVSERNKAIVDIFTSTENKRGLKAQLAKTYNLSRKSIDLILEEQGIDPRVGSKKKVKHKRPTKQQAILDSYQVHLKKGTPVNKINTSIAQALGCSVSYVVKTLKAHQ